MWTWSTSLSTDTPGMHLQTQKCMQNTHWEQTGVPDQRERNIQIHAKLTGFPDSSVGKDSTCNAGDPFLIPGLGRSAGEGIGYPLQYSGLENSMDCPWGHKELDMVEWLANSLSKLGRQKELGGKTGVSVGLDLLLVGGGTEAGIRSPQQGDCLSQRRNV